ncbi:histidinol-phosphate transaminase, partial [Cupriavidus sp. UYPR2.512]|uniref:pyridoxal phosphate-dependent aminotransferase n=1 Tax=Cupriavidus sp. UYPR2.512 TaxID=1080187 RepID=UPI0018DF3BEA
RHPTEGHSCQPPLKFQTEWNIALAAFHGRGLTGAQFFSANSGVEVLSLVEDALMQPGQRAIICPPCFGEYSKSLLSKGCEIDKVPLIEPGFRLDTNSILRKVAKNTALLYLCNPNNPTGTWFVENVLSGVLDKIPDNVTVIYDEVYYQFATEESLPDAIRHVLDDRNIVIVHSFSKAYGLAGMRIGYGIAPQRIARKVQNRKRNFHLNTAGMEAAMAALEDIVHLQRTVDNNHVERRRLAAGLNALKLEVTPSQANFLMVRCPEGYNAEELTALLVGHGVMVRPAAALHKNHGWYTRRQYALTHFIGYDSGGLKTMRAMTGGRQRFFLCTISE